MTQLRINFQDNRRSFEPGQELAGAAGWQLDPPPKAIEARLMWFTKGKGTQDVKVVDTFRFEQPQAAEARPFVFHLPAEPYSFSGSLISLIWAVELVALPGNESTREEFLMAPNGKEVTLTALPK